MRTRHVWARPGQHVRVHRPHYGGGGSDTSDGSLWWEVLKALFFIAVTIAAIAGALYLFVKFWPLILIVSFFSVFHKAILKK